MKSICCANNAGTGPDELSGTETSLFSGHKRPPTLDDCYIYVVWQAH